MGLLACADDDEPSEAERPAEPKPIQVEFQTQQFATVTGDITTVKGTVSPPDAEVEVDGVTAQVDGGVWSSRVRLEEFGENTVQATASKPGYAEDTTSTILIRKRSAEEAAALRARKAREREQQQEQQQEQAAEDAASEVQVPGLVGERLDVAKDMLRGIGLRAKTLGGGLFGVVVESNWTVCEIRPGEGSQVQEGGPHHSRR